MKYILIASTKRDVETILRRCFPGRHQIERVDSMRACLDRFRNRRYEFLFIDLDVLSDGRARPDFHEKLRPFWQAFPTAELVILTPPHKIRDAVQAVKAGASDYLTYPLDPREVELVVENISKAIRLRSELDYLRDESWRGESFAVLRTHSSRMREVLAKVRSVTQTDTTVLLTGETGTGKGVIAKLIHQNSRRSAKQFVSIHCGAIPENLLESELFGHEKGAFTGAVRRKLGRFEIADGGTIFLDEIGTISSPMQVKLLQVLQDKTFSRVGGEAVLTTDVRVIAATNADLEKMCEQGTFRRDLYYRINVFPIEIPPLRERVEDIPLLAEAFLQRLNRLYGKGIQQLHPEALKALQRYPWPGNVRELENLIERAYILETSPLLTPRSFPAQLFDRQESEPERPIDTSCTLQEIRQRHLQELERRYLVEQLARNRGRIKETAAAAGVGVRQLHKLMTRYGLRKEDFKG